MHTKRRINLLSFYLILTNVFTTNLLLKTFKLFQGNKFMPNFRFVLLLIFFIRFASVQAQNSLLQDAVQQFNAESKKIQPWNHENFDLKKTPQSSFQSGVKQYLERFRNTAFLNKIRSKSMNSDSMLIIGATPGDSLIITGNWICNVDILVIGDGKLRFKKANATLHGNLYVWGEHAEITADSSSLYIPQLYFYQRGIVAAGAGKIRFNHVTLDFSGLSHNFVASDSSTISLTDVTKVGFTTNGVYGKAKYFINGTNLAGEFVIGDKCQLDFHNAKTVLLWHEVPENAKFHFSFPAAGNVATYDFHPNLSGIENINYQIKLDNCTDVMWALMPANGSDVDIQNSKIRAIGLWFLQPDSVNVNGLVNNSTYTDFTATLADRNLRLRNSTVQTWSLYTMQKSEISVSGCIVGEIGSMGTSQVQTSSVFVDGSGGYMWASDTTFFIAYATPLTTAVRSERNGILIYAYSPLSVGTATALGNSTLLAIQSSLPEEPVPFDNANVWNVNIQQPSSGKSNSIIPILGYALIDRTATCIHPDMAWYQVFYSTSDNDSLIAITPRITTEKRNDTLAKWNTADLKPGQYLLHMLVSDASANPVIIEVVKSFSLNPGEFGIDESKNPEIKVFPNPVSDILQVNSPFEKSSAFLFNSCGMEVWNGNLEKGTTPINFSVYPSGLYLLKVFHENGISDSKLIKQ